MICLTCLLNGVPIILKKADIATVAPLNGYVGAMVLLQGGTRFFVTETVETILQKKPETFSRDCKIIVDSRIPF